MMKRITSVIGTTLSKIPPVAALITLRRKIRLAIAFYLFRERRFISAAILRYWFGLLSSVVLFVWVWQQFIDDPSLAMRYGKIILGFVPLSYEAARVSSRLDDYRSRGQRKTIPLQLKLLRDKDVDVVPAWGWQVIGIPGSWMLVALTIYLASRSA